MEKKIVIIDLEQDINELVKNSDIVKIYRGFVKTENVNIINIGSIKKKTQKNLRKKLISSFETYAKYIKKKYKNINPYLLSFFNIRNDSNRLYDKIFYFFHLKEFLKKKNYTDVSIISDNPNFKDLYFSLNVKKIKIIYKKKIIKKNIIFFYLSKISIFYFKTFLLLFYIKIFSKRAIIDKIEEAGLTLFPQNFNKLNNEFYKKNVLYLNFLLTDESHLNNSLIKNFREFKKINGCKNLIIIEKHIGFYFLIKSYFAAFKKIFAVRDICNKKIYYNKIDISYVTKELMLISLINNAKLNIYNNAILKVIKENNITKFHYYMFEYNLGFYLCNLVRLNTNVNLVGYQHGIYSNKLMWLAMLNKNELRQKYLPHNIKIKFSHSLSDYKIFFNKRDILNNKELKNNLPFINKKPLKKISTILVYLGLHDAIDMICEIKDNFKKFENIKIDIKLHPKFKDINTLQLIKNIKVIKKVKNKYDLILLSTTSTMVYDLILKNILFKILKPKYMSSLLPENLEKFIKIS